MRRRRFFALLATGAMFASLPFAIAFIAVVQSEQHYRLSSTALGMDRRITVYTPPGYDPSATRRYPVLYSLDGQSFRHGRLPAIWVRLLSAIGQTPPIIVVAINNEGVRDIDMRPRAPVPLHDDPPVSGRDAAFTAFIRDELMPFVARRYRSSAYRVISGHSLGGFYVVDRLSRSPGLFQAHFAYSPSFTHDRASLVRLERAVAMRRSEPTLLYMNIGEENALTLVTFGRAARMLPMANPEGRLHWQAERHRAFFHPIIMVPGQARALTMLGDVASACALSAPSDAAAMPGANP